MIKHYDISGTDFSNAGEASSSFKTMLRKLGVEEKEISKSIFLQSGLFFLLPLLLACLHSYFGMRLGKFGLSMVVIGSYTKPILFTSAVVVLIYGGYFLLTFLGSKAITKEQK